MSAPLPLSLRMASVEARGGRTGPAPGAGGDALVEALRDAAGPRRRDAVVIADGGPDWVARYGALGHRVRGLALRGPTPPPLPVDDSALDLLHVHALAEQLAHPGAEMAEWLRVLRPGGLLLLSGVAPGERGPRPPADHVFARGLHPGEVAALLETVGLRAVETRRLRDPRDTASRSWWARWRPRRDDGLYLAWGRVA